MKRAQPFRGCRLPKLQEMLRQKIHIKKYDTRKRNKSHSIGFAVMIRTLKCPRDAGFHGGYSHYSINWRHGWKRSYRLHHVKRRNEAEERFWAASGMPF